VSRKSCKAAHVEKENKFPIGENNLEVKLLVEKKILCNQRLGHIGEKGLKYLENKNLVEGLDDCNLEFNFCEHCIYGKQHCVSFYSIPHKSFGVLDYIHSDVFGLVNLPFISKSKYYVSFIDDYLRMAFVYIFKI
jgi:hypothetical protein